MNMWYKHTEKKLSKIIFVICILTVTTLKSNLYCRKSELNNCPFRMYLKSFSHPNSTTTKPHLSVESDKLKCIEPTLHFVTLDFRLLSLKREKSKPCWFIVTKVSLIKVYKYPFQNLPNPIKPSELLDWLEGKLGSLEVHYYDVDV